MIYSTWVWSGISNCWQWRSQHPASETWPFSCLGQGLMWDLNDSALREATTRQTANVYIALEQSKVFLTKGRSAHDRIAHFHGVSGSFFQLFRRDTTCSARPLQYLTPSKQQSYSKRPWCRAHWENCAAHTHKYQPIGRVGSDCGFDICWYFRMLPAPSSTFFA